MEYIGGERMDTWKRRRGQLPGIKQESPFKPTLHGYPF